MAVVTGPVKLMIRQDDNGIVRASLAMTDESAVFEVATVHLGVLDRVPGAFEAWKKMLMDAMTKLILDSSGVVVDGFTESKPPCQN